MTAARQLALPLPETAPAPQAQPAAASVGGLVLNRLPDRAPAGLLAPRLAPLMPLRPRWPLAMRIAHGIASLLAAATFVAFMAALAMVAA